MLRKLLSKYKSMPIQVKASLWFLICSFFQKGISMITTPIFTRILTTAEYGQISVFISWQQIITPIVCLNLYSGVYSQGLVKFEDDRKRFSSSLQGLSVTLVSVWFIIYFVARDFLNPLFSLATPEMVAMILIIWASAVFSFWSADQRVDFKYRELVIVTVLVSIFQPLISIIFILNSEDKVLARVWGMAVVQIILYSWMFISQMKKGKCFFSKEYWSYALKFNIPLLPHYLSMNVLSSSDRIMINKMVGQDKAGIYNLAYSVAFIMMMFNTALLQTLEPWIYRKLKGKKSNEIASVAYPCFVLIAVLNVILIAFAPEIIAIFAPAPYQEAIWVIPSIALSVFFTFLYTFFATFEFYYEKTNYVAIATVGGAILNIVMNYVGIQKFGYVAAGYTTLFSYMLFAILHYCFMRKICKQYLNNLHPYSLKVIIFISVGSLVAAFTMMLTYKNNLLRYGIIAGILIIALIMRKKIIQIIKILVGIKKQKN